MINFRHILVLSVFFSALMLCCGCKKLQEQISENQAKINSLTEAMHKLEKVDSDLETAIANLGVTQGSHAQDIAKLKEEKIKIEAQIVSLNDIVAKLASTEWVNANFSTKEELQAAIGDISVLGESVSQLQKDVSSLEESLGNLEETVGGIQTSIQNIETSISGMLSRLESVERILNGILDMIQSISVISDYTDYGVDACKDSITIRFLISPVEAAAKLVNFPDSISLEGKYVKAPRTKGGESESYPIPFPLKTLSFDGEALVLTVSSKYLEESFFSGGSYAAAVLKVKCGLNVVSSQQFNLHTPQQIVASFPQTLERRFYECNQSREIWDYSDTIKAFTKSGERCRFATLKTVFNETADTGIFFPEDDKFSEEADYTCMYPGEAVKSSDVIEISKSSSSINVYGAARKMKGATRVEFQPLCATLIIKLKSQIAGSAKYLSVFGPKETIIAGSAKLVEEAGVFKLGAVTDGTKTIRYKSPRISQQGSYNIISIIPQDNEIKLTVTLEKLDGSKVSKTLDAQKYEAGKIYEFEMEDLATVNLDDYTDLSLRNGSDIADSTANCYIVPAFGKYRFPAVRGNDVSNEVKGISSVDIVWQTFGQKGVCRSVLTEYGYAENESGRGFIYFNYANSDGTGANSIIAAKDKDGKVLWNWHIWIPLETVGTVLCSSDVTLMDRNLGATAQFTPEKYKTIRELSENRKMSSGLFYQWGRKDPFPLNDVYDEAGDDIIKYTLTDEPSVHTMDYAIMHPNEMIAYPYDIKSYSGAHYGTWLPKGHKLDTLWNENYKTKYDPCPPGYRIPGYNRNPFAPVDSQRLKQEDYYCLTTVRYGILFQTHDMPEPLRLPLCGNQKTVAAVYYGYQNPANITWKGQVTDVHRRGSLWYSTSYGDTCVVRINISKDNKEDDLGPGNIEYQNSFISKNFQNLARGCAIRCMKED